jgi:dihydroflavonol-4-reductase
MVDVRDVAKGHILAAERGRIGQRYILGNENLNLSELLGFIEEITGFAMPKVRIPYWLALIYGVLSELIADYITSPSAKSTTNRCSIDEISQVFQ